MKQYGGQFNHISHNSNPVIDESLLVGIISIPTKGNNMNTLLSLQRKYLNFVALVRRNEECVKVPQTIFPSDYPDCGMNWVVNPFMFNDCLTIQELDDMDSTRWNIPLHIAVMQHCIF